MAARGDPIIRVRLANWINEWMRHDAKSNRRSMTGQIEYCLEQYIHHFQKTEKAPDPALESKSDAPHVE